MASLKVRMADCRSVGNGDTCPLVPAHGPMHHLQGSDPPTQWCPHVMHDGKLGSTRRGIEPVPRTRAIWPLYGFEESVETYLARLYRAVSRGDTNFSP